MGRKFIGGARPHFVFRCCLDDKFQIPPKKHIDPCVMMSPSMSQHVLPVNLS